MTAEEAKPIAETMSKPSTSPALAHIQSLFDTGDPSKVLDAVQQNLQSLLEPDQLAGIAREVTAMPSCREQSLCV